MSTETEVKIRIDNADAFCRRLEGLNPAVLSARHFEDNCLLDFADRRLSADHCLLRVRFAGGKHILTYKGPPRPDGVFKVREELETLIENGAVLLQTLERIGLAVSFRYQKYRREFFAGDVHIAVDETPIGNFIELEGPEGGIRSVAQKLGISEGQFLRSSYYSLYIEYCSEKNESPGFMVFQNGM